MRRLSVIIKRRIIEHLASYRTPNEVVRLIAEEFGVPLTPRHVRAYDPSCFQFAAGPKLAGYHAGVRERFVNELGDIAIAQRACRLRSLQHLHDELLARLCAGSSPDPVDLSRELRGVVEQAAKEVGNVYTNVSRQTGRVDHAHLVVELSADQRRNMLADRLRKAFDRMPTTKLVATAY